MTLCLVGAELWTDGQTDRHDEATSRFSRKTKLCIWKSISQLHFSA